MSIGSGCWLGAGAVVLPGTTLGRNVVVAAGVRGARCEFRDHAVVAGVPGKVVRRYADGAWHPPLTPGPERSAPPEGWPSGPSLDS